jgi:valyl-tRNA synthetase
MTEKRQISQGYIIRILQHFATKLWNITNFVMLFQADEIFVLIKILGIRGKVHLLSSFCVSIKAS